MLQPWKASTKLKGFVVALVLILAVPAMIQHQVRDPAVLAAAIISVAFVKPAEVIIEVDEDPEETAAAVESLPQPAVESKEVSASAPEEHAVAPEPFQRVTVHVDLPSFNAGYVMDVLHREPVGEELIPQQYTLLSPIVVTPKPEPRKMLLPWSATLDQRKEIARSYLVANCEAILPFDGMESAADKQDTEVRFMAAKNSNGVIAVVLNKMRQHSSFVSGICPAAFISEKLFPPKKK